MTAVATQTCFIQFILRFSQPLADDEIQHHTSRPVLFARMRWSDPPTSQINQSYQTRLTTKNGTRKNSRLTHD